MYIGRIYGGSSAGWSQVGPEGISAQQHLGGSGKLYNYII